MTLALVAAAIAVLVLGVIFVFRSRKGPELPPSPAAGASPAALHPAKPKQPETPAAAHPSRPASVESAAERAPSDRPKAVEAAKSSVPASPAAPSEPAAPTRAAPKRKRDVEGLRKGLASTRGGFISRLTALFRGRKAVDPGIFDQMEEVMISSDVGVRTTQAMLGRLRERASRGEIETPEQAWNALRDDARTILSRGGDGGLPLRGKPTVVLMVGVNGVGKTTTIGKLATRFRGAGSSVCLAAGDTFRAAAVQQLEIWGKRAGVEVVRGKDGADPAAVAFDATTKASGQGTDLLLIDTAGRLHTKAPLMDEIRKVRKTVAKALDGAPHETLLVLDATTGQNALVQAQLFNEAIELTGVVLTKLDGTAKGGIVLGICDELKIPVRLIGIGERAEDLRDFDADEFVEALFGDIADASSGEETVA